jgi:hypothetical protein
MLVIIAASHQLAFEEEPPLNSRDLSRGIRQPETLDGTQSQPAWMWEPHPQAVHVIGTAGSVCLFDCRLFHCLAPNCVPHPNRTVALCPLPQYLTPTWWVLGIVVTSETRTMINVRFSPRLPDGALGAEAHDGFMGSRDPMPRSIFATLPLEAALLYSHDVVDG